MGESNKASDYGLGLPWRLMPGAVTRELLVIKNSTGSVVNTDRQKQYAVEAANAMPRLMKRLKAVETAYVELFNRYEPDSYSTGEILGRVYESIPDETTQELQLVRDGNGNLRFEEVESQPENGDSIPQTVNPTSEPDKTPENTVSASSSAIIEAESAPNYGPNRLTAGELLT